MSFLNSIVADMREKHLWPLALVLLAALVAIPILLSSNSSPSTPPAPSTAPRASALPAVSVKEQTGKVHLTGHGRDPFGQGATKKVKSTSTSSSATTHTNASPAGATTDSPTTASTTGSGSTTASTTGSGGSTTTTTTTTTTPTPTPTPPPAGLSSTEAYAVSVGITNDFGGVNTIDPAERLGVLPSTNQQLVAQLGVLKGARRVMFAVAPGTIVNGPGSCVPGPVDCQILSLPVGANESISMRSATGESVRVAEFAVTGVSIRHFPSVTAAHNARRTASAEGQKLLDQNRSKLTALSLFPYRPSLGVVVDERTLQVGGD